jgi:WD40 repeat protein/DNA-binding SARP family transcriptional activator
VRLKFAHTVALHRFAVVTLAVIQTLLAGIGAILAASRKKMNRLEVRLLGQFEIRLGGQPVDLPSRPAQSLLAYLALTAGTAHRRERLAGLLWPDASESNARNNLRQALFRLRQVIETDGEPYLLADNITLAFNRDADYWLDTTALEGDAAEPGAATALATYRGELLPGFYDDWVVLEREHLRAAFERKMQQWLEKLVEEERWADVLEWGERWIALGGAPEPAYRALMMAHAGLGEAATVAAVYQRCVEALRNELGVEPSEQTRTLYEQLQTGQGAGLSPFRLRAFAPLLIDEPPAPGEPPFKGLQYFDAADADLFFGRETLTARLVGHLRQSRFLAVIVGASGSGKSSVVRAGLVPALQRGEPLADGTLPPEGSQDWRLHLITPSARPLESLAANLTRDSESVTATATLMDDMRRDSRALHLHIRRRAEGEGQILLVVDQFEELFTLCRDETERRAFINNLMTAINSSSPDSGDGSTTLILTLRADFYSHCAQYDNLREALAKHQEYIGPMNAEELRRAIEEPARRNGWEFEPGLVDLILRDIGAGEDRQPEPGALPLLSHALLETWHRRRGRALTLKGYAECGGVRGAIARTAETVYRKLVPEGQTIARNLFIRLTELGEGETGVDTRRRVALTELVTNPQLRSSTESVLKTLTDARLITTTADSAEVAHEALIREWPALRRWLTENREGLQLHRHLTEAAQAWEALGREPGELYRGARLSQAAEWAEANPNELNALEREFLEASQAGARREEAEREAARQRELDAAQKLADAEKRRAEEQARTAGQLRRRAIILAGVLALAVLAALAAVVFGQQARTTAEQNASLAQQNAQVASTAQIASTQAIAEQATAQAQANLRATAEALAIVQREAAEEQARLAASRELAAAALTNLNADPERSVLLALHALDSAHTTEAENALHRALLDLHLLRTLRGHTSVVWNVAVSADGARIATAGFEGVAKVWDTETGQELLTFAGHKSDVFGVAFSPDGKRAATASADGTAKVWDVATGEELLILRGHTVLQSGEPLVTGVAFSPDGTRIATSSFDRTVIVYDAATSAPLLTLRGHADAIYGFTFSPDGTRIATAGYDGVAKVWDSVTGDELLTLAPQAGVIQRVAFSPDGARLLTADDRNTATLFDLTTGETLLTLEGHTGPVHGVAFSPDGTRAATASLDATAKIWDARTGQELLTLVGHNGPVEDVAFLPDGQRLVTVSGDGTARIWDLAPGHESLALFGGSAVYSPDGERLAASLDSIVIIYDAETGGRLLTFTAAGPQIQSLAYSPDGKRLVTASGPPLFGDGDSVVEVWDSESGQRTLTLPGPEGGGHGGIVVRAVFGPDGNRLATGGFDQTAKIWDTSTSLSAGAATGKLLRTLSGHAFFVWDVAFSPDGARLVTGSWDDTAKIWDVGSGKELSTLPAQKQPHDVFRSAFAPDGKRLALGLRDGSVLVFDAATGEEVLRLAAHTSFVVSLAFSPDGSRLATSAFDNAARVWDTTTGEETLSLVLPAGVQNVAFNADGARLVTSALDGVSRVHVLPIEELIALARSRVTRSLTREECRTYLHVEQCP